MAIGLAGLYATRKWVRRVHGDRHSHNEIVGFYLSAVCVFYGITLGLIAVATWQAFSDVDARVGEEEVNLWDYSPELTRPFRALKLWMSLQVFGADAFAAALKRTFYLAEYAEKQLRARKNWEIISSAQMAVVTFRYVPKGQQSGSAESGRRIDALNRAIAARMQEQGFALVLTTELRGQTVLRLCTINPRTTEEDIVKTVEALDEHALNEAGLGKASG